MDDSSLIVQLDDIDTSEPQTNRLDYLFWLKAKYPFFCVNLFVIPGRSEEWWIEELKNITWVRPCMHGWSHDEKEVITPEMLESWVLNGFPKIYKGPNWKLPGKTRENLIRAKFRIIEKPLPDNQFTGHIWSPADLQKLDDRLKTAVSCKLLEGI